MGKPFYEDFDMTWATTLKPLSTSRPLCLPTVCISSQSDLAGLAAELSKAFCSTMGAYPLQTCAVNLVKPK